MDITKLSAIEMRKKLYEKEISARELIEGHLKKINEDKSNFVNLNEEALASADRIDEKIKNGERLGLLAGIPIGIKDNIMTKGIETSCGSKILENFIPPYDASVIERIKSADGIVMGKTKMDEFSIGSADKTASAVKNGEISLGIGTDTVGELRQSAFSNDIVGIKPTNGIVSRYGVVPVANTLDQVGVYGRDVQDAVFILSAITGFDEKDSTSFKNPEGTIIFGNFPKEIDNDYLKTMKIAVPKEFILDNDINKSIKLLESLGANIEEISMVNLKYALPTYEAISAAEFSSNMARFDGVRYGYRSKEYGSLDELYINTRSEALGDEVKRKIVMGTYLLTKGSNDLYEKALRVRTLIREDFKKAFEKYDILLSPMDAGNGNLFTSPVNLAGLCAISLMGIQLIGDRYKEANIIKAAIGFEGGMKNGL